MRISKNETNNVLLHTHIYIYVYIHVCMCVYIYALYMYMSMAHPSIHPDIHMHVAQ